ncbi:MAG: diguanylate cyclase [Lachnospiraceae bacterium]|nr:diguanylate cyclase [Lachnospiraceae bacterium]
MKEKNGGIRKKLLPIVILPVILLSCLITLVGVSLFYGFYMQSIQSDLASTTDTLLNCMNFALSGDYKYENDMLLKGDMNITDSTMILRIKEQSQIDITIFWDDLRIMTTLEDEYGISAVGTRADSEITHTVLREGESVFAKNLMINGKQYVGYYVPIKNTGDRVVGMVFAGKQKDLVYQKIMEVIVWFAALSVIIVVFSVFIILRFTSYMISDIDSINHFLRAISGGDLGAALGDHIINRNDEIGSIGVYALKMRDDIKNLIEKDSLTGLYNRRSCHNRLDAIVQKKERYTIVMCDIDFFKKVNDTYGHDAGDYVLTEISALIKKGVMDCGFASRWGGEEFLLVYTLGLEDTVGKVAQLRQSILMHEFDYDGKKMQITMTFGVAEGAQDMHCEKVIQSADEKLYVGKNSGRNRVVA